MTFYILLFILFNKSLYHTKCFCPDLAKHLLKVEKSTKKNFFLLFKISKKENNVKTLSAVECDFIN